MVKARLYQLAIVLLTLAVLYLAVDHMQQADHIAALEQRLEENQNLLEAVRGDSSLFCGDLPPGTPSELPVREAGEKAIKAELQARQAKSRRDKRANPHVGGETGR